MVAKPSGTGRSGAEPAVQASGQAPTEGGSAEPAEALAALVAKLRAELTGVRTAMRNRAVIEQAKGVLVERLGVSPDEGFDQLVRLSQRANIKLIEVAAAIVGTTAPDPAAAPVTELIDELGRRPSPGRPAASPSRGAAGPGGAAGTPAAARRPAHEAMQAQHQLISSRIASATSYNEVADAIGTAPSSWPSPAVVVLTLLDL